MRPTYCGATFRPAPWTMVATVAALLATLPSVVEAQNYPPPLSEAQVDSARSLIAAMKADERGPYLRIRWFCNDGTIEPPQGTPCSDRGSGNQHAELKPEALRLGRMALNVGTILQSLSFEDFRDTRHADDRLKQLVLEAHLVAVDDGWVLRRARYYRGARQAEDEEQAGTRLLRELLGDAGWTARNYWLANRVTAVVPHVGIGGDQLVHRIRNLASEVAEIQPGFLPLRVKIHSFPSAADVEEVGSWMRRSNLSEPVRRKLQELHEALTSYYDPSAQLENLALLERRFRNEPTIADGIATVRMALQDRTPREALAAIGALSERIRRHVGGSTSGADNLRLVDLNLALHDTALRIGMDAVSADEGATRSDVVLSLVPLLDLAYGAGLLSNRERSALVDRARELAGQESIRALDYREDVAYLARALDWSTRTIRSSMTPALERFEAVEPRASTFPDAVTRGSVLLPMSRVLGRLAEDGDDALGTSHVVFGQAVRTGLRGMNPGMAVGPLLEAEHEDLATLDRSGIYILPETASELRPVAGVLSLDAGNLLSHVQLLARNLGIPNASIAASILPLLHANAPEGTGSEAGPPRTVLFAVSPLGRVVVQDTQAVDGPLRTLLAPTGPAADRLLLSGERLRLDVARPISLAELRSEHSGVLVGPKAANLGQLAHVFPERVSDGLALPFGMFARHVDRPFEGARPLERLAAAYDESLAMREAGAPDDSVDARMFRALAEVRRAIEALPWTPDMREAIVAAVRAEFGDDLSTGIFIRSDTNVEDLPQFSGAGLNLTVPNQRSVEDILSSVKRVWTSPFSERAYLWRKQILDGRSVVFPSVLLLETVASQHSGVLISSGLQYGGAEDLTIAAAEGIGGAVDGEDAETIVARADGSVLLLSQAKAPRRRVLDAKGGVEMVPARKPETLLSDGEIRQLRDIVRTWKGRTPDATADRIWDMEFGVIDGYVWLFQVRPFIRFRSSQLLDRLSVLDEEMMKNADRPVALAGRP